MTKKIYKVDLSVSKTVLVWAEDQDDAKKIALRDGLEDLAYAVAEESRVEARWVNVTPEEVAQGPHGEDLPWGDTEEACRVMKVEDANCKTLVAYMRGDYPPRDPGEPEERLPDHPGQGEMFAKTEKDR